ncbi:MAG TPA: hypothetical protein VLK60_11635, partial [Variovorax sp.]|nr:hypothetical protein [Variovorax sp.]
MPPDPHFIRIGRNGAGHGGGFGPSAIGHRFRASSRPGATPGPVIAGDAATAARRVLDGLSPGDGKGPS